MKNLFLSLILVGLWSCDAVKVQNGELPVEYKELVTSYLGPYEGEFDGVEGTLTLALDGLKPTLSFESETMGSDWLGNGCGSRVGNLKSFTPKVDKEGNFLALKEAIFVFDDGACSIEGKLIQVNFKRKNTNTKVTVALLDFSIPTIGDIEGWDVYMYGKFSN